MAAIGHNGYSFDDVVAENLERGLLLAQRDCAAKALQDPRLGQRHRVVLAQLILMMNQQSGMAYPGRRFLSEVTGYSEAGVAKTISELVDLGYVISARRAPEPGRRPLAHYSIIKPTVEELQEAIAWHIEALRRPDVTPVGNVTWASKFTPSGNVTPVPNVTPVGNVSNATQEIEQQNQCVVSDVTPVGNVSNATQEIEQQNQCVVSDVTPVGNVTPVVPTVTSSSSLLPDTPLLSDAKPEPKRRLPKGTRLDPEWKIDDNRDWGRWTVEHFAVQPSTVRKEAEKFRDFWLGKPGKDGTKADWFATWRNWARRAFAGKERDSFSDAALLTADAEQESEHDRQLAILRQARLQNGLN